MRVRNLSLIALGALFAVAAAAPAFADEDWHHHERQEWRNHEWREHEWREHHRYGEAPPITYGYPGYYR
jgi:hypothetical protein